MKLDTVNVLHSSGGVPTKIISYPDTDEGNKLADISFIRIIDAISHNKLGKLLNAKDISTLLNIGLYECDDESVYLIHS